MPSRWSGTRRGIGGRGWAWAALLVPLVALAQDAEKTGAPDLSAARRLLQTGRYAQAIEAFEAVGSAAQGKDRPTVVAAAVGRARALASTGEVGKALEALATVTGEGQEPAPDALAQIAEIEFQRGRWAEAEAAAKRAVEADANHLPARWVLVRLLDAKGERDEATKACRWFIERQNVASKEIEADAEKMLLVGQAAERYYRASARGEDLAESLNDVLTSLYEPAIALDESMWQAAWLQGRMFLAGYQEGDARKELNRALAINASAPEVLVALGQADLQGYQLAEGRAKAEQAIEVNPAYGPAYVLLADLNISDERFEDALKASRKAVELNPYDEEALARLAASARLLVDPTAAAAAEQAALAQNPKPALFYAALGERLSDRRKYHEAERAFLRAIEADPAGATAQIGLGMLYMQIGREAEAKGLFAAAFEADPFNVRAKNMMAVLERIANYTPFETEHYRVLVHPQQDPILGRIMADYLESEHKGMVERFGFEPPGKTVIEILKDHETFSGRTTALPFIPTVGACTGKVVALASPRSTPKPFNWARVLTHEVAHVITLQQTRFNIPHWYTEALAVESEGKVRPQEWNKLLQERIPARKLLNLETINLGFIRPKEPEERQLAYCQAQLYAQYMTKTYGPDSHAKLLDAYRRGLTTPKAIEETFQTPVAEFEKGYLAFLDEVLKTVRTRVADEKPVRFSQLLEDVEKTPDDAALNGRVAYEYFARRDYKSARPFADKALKLDKAQPFGAYVKARLMQVVGDEAAALEALEPALDPDKPDERVMDLLAELLLNAGRLDEAEKLYELARRDDPLHTKWIAGMARVHLRQGNAEAFLADLEQLAANDADDLAVRQALTERYLSTKEYEKAKNWATECLYIDTYDVSNHVSLGDAFLGLEKADEAVGSYRTALELKPKKPVPIQIKLAEALAAAGKKDEAAKVLDGILEADPEQPEAKALREKVGE